MLLASLMSILQDGDPGFAMDLIPKLQEKEQSICSNVSRLEEEIVLSTQTGGYSSDEEAGQTNGMAKLPKVLEVDF